MRIVIDSAIPYINNLFESYADVLYIPGDKIDHSVVKDADALVIRTRTRCDSKLLDGSKVRLITTATIGTDHIDHNYCREHGIIVCSAPGCNARGVLQWVSAVLLHITTTDNKRPEEYTLGVVGVGNVGSLVSKYARHWGFRVMECDPPRQAREGGEFHTIEQIAQHCDIITLHTPLDTTTHHLINKSLIQTMRTDATVINASRGSVVDNRAVMESGHRYYFDVWEGEPNIPNDILANATLATPHIAGYSVQGKANATAMCVRAIASFFGFPLCSWYPPQITPTTPQLISWDELRTILPTRYDIATESDTLKQNCTNFETLRNNYNYREEWF